MTDDLLAISGPRNREAAGVALSASGEAKIFKRLLSAAQMTKEQAYQRFMDANLGDLPRGGALIGHSRLATQNGGAHPADNQPNGGTRAIAVHGGLLVNRDALWTDVEPQRRKSDSDAEVFVHLLEKYLRSEGVQAAVAHVYGALRGISSTLTLLPSARMLVAASNNGSLYSCQSDALIVFATESDTLRKLIERNPAARRLLDVRQIRQLLPGNGLLVNWDDLQTTSFAFAEAAAGEPLSAPVSSFPDNHEAACAHSHAPDAFNAARFAPYEIDDAPIRKLRRCTRCVLPETMPFIEFDDEGV